MLNLYMYTLLDFSLGHINVSGEKKLIPKNGMRIFCVNMDLDLNCTHL